jgi:hypothetical protein
MNDSKIKRMERNANSIRKEVMFLEAVKLQKEYSGTQHLAMLKDDHALQFDLNRTLILTLFNELFDRLIKNGFYINLNDRNVNYYDFRKLIKGNTEFSTAESLYNMGILTDSINYLASKYETKKIDVIQLLIENGQYSLITKIITSEKINDKSKIELIKRVINSGPDKLMEIFSEDSKENRFFELVRGSKGNAKNLVEQNLSKIKSENVYIEKKIRETINQDFKDEFSRFNAREFIKFFVNFNLVNMNNIIWDYKGNDISSAAAALILHNSYLSQYLYDLPNYKETNKDVKDASDKIILSRLLGGRWDLKHFLKTINFEATPDKLKHIEKEILRMREQSNRKIDKETIEEIVYLFLRKTKKEYYKEMLKAIESLRKNIDEKALADKRKQLVGVLKDFNTVLLEQVPAKTNVGSVKIIKK